MSGVGSTNAMKKGSGNNPFLAYSKADMQGFLNSAYTGRIVKYAGPSTKVEVLTSDRNKDAQHLVFDITKPFTRSSGGLVRYAMKIDKTTDDGVKTTYICHKWINKLTGRLQNGLGNLDESEYWVYALIEIDDINFDNIKGKNVKFLAVTESLSEIPSLIDLHQDWPTTKGINGWQTNCINEAGKITLWSYSEDVKYSYAEGSSVGSDEMIYYEPYVVNELYKVVYGNGRYYFEEFYHISDDVTTATVEDVASGKTFYDFTGTKQTGTGTKINPYLATDLDTFKSFPTGSFIKWLGPDRTVLDETTGQMLIQNEIYRAVEDGDILQYVILPTLSNPADPIDVAEGKEVINQLGAVMIGTGHTYHTVVANDVYSWEDVASASIVDKIKTVSKAISELTDDELNILVSKKFLSAHIDVVRGDSMSPGNVFLPTSKGRGLALQEPSSFSDSMTASLDALNAGYVALGEYASGIYGSYGSKNHGYKSIVGTRTILTFNYLDD